MAEPDLRVFQIKLRPDDREAMAVIRQRLQKKEPDKAVTDADVVREALRIASGR